jgi:hypothetical protein
MKDVFLIICILLPLTITQANNLPFQEGEELTFDIHYKYGLLMPKAGTANWKIERSSYNNRSSYLSTLDFRTNSFFDRIYKMRDTLRSHITAHLEPLYHIRVINEGNTQFSEEVFFNRFGPEYTEVRVRRESRQQVRIDSIFSANTIGFDLLNLIQYIRSLSLSELQSFPPEGVATFVGRERIAITVRYEGQSIVERSATHKFNTYKIAFDFTDKAFNESRSAIEVWMSSDENRIPIRIRAKLRVGAAEVNLTSWKNLKHPFSAEIIIPVRR